MLGVRFMSNGAMKFCTPLLTLAALLGCSGKGPERTVADATAGLDGADDARFEPGDCTHPDWPGHRICCGRAGEQQGVDCVPPALVDHPCSAEGEQQDVKAYTICCRGLTAISRARLDDAGVACVQQLHVDPTRLCTRCGDGTCGRGENRCNCPQDCAVDAAAP